MSKSPPKTGRTSLKSDKQAVKDRAAKPKPTEHDLRALHSCMCKAIGTSQQWGARSVNRIVAGLAEFGVDVELPDYLK